jgi:hypothetical protein
MLLIVFVFILWSDQSMTCNRSFTVDALSPLDEDLSINSNEASDIVVIFETWTFDE